MQGELTLLATWMLVLKLCKVKDIAVNNQIQVVRLVMRADIAGSEGLRHGCWRCEDGCGDAVGQVRVSQMGTMSRQGRCLFNGSEGYGSAKAIKLTVLGTNLMLMIRALGKVNPHMIAVASCESVRGIWS